MRRALPLTIAILMPLLIIGVVTYSDRVVSPSPAPSQPDTDPRHGRWWNLMPFFADQNTLSGFDLAFGVFDGTDTGSVSRRYGPLTGESMRGAIPVADGTLDGTLAAAYWDGVRSEVWTVQAQTGQETLITRTPDVVSALAFSHDERSLFIATRDPLSRLPKAILQVPISGGPALSIAALDVALGPDVSFEMLSSADGSLVFLVCGSDCRLQALDTASGLVRWSASTPLGTLAGGTPSTIVERPRACEQPCEATAFDLANGERFSIGFVCSAAVVVTEPASLVSDADEGTCRVDSYMLVRWPLDADRGAVIFERPDDARALVTSDERTGYAVDPGWVVLAPRGEIGGAADAWFVRVSDGLVIQR